MITPPHRSLTTISTSLQVAWLRVDTQTILTIQNHVITKNHRIGISHTEHRIWYLHIREIKESDRGWYMCQINTDPMKSQVGFLEIVGKCTSLNASECLGFEMGISRLQSRNVLSSECLVFIIGKNLQFGSTT